MLDAIVVGAGPAGSIAALMMARTGARVLIVDRATFPRDKLCGDTINPGAVRFLREVGLDVESGPLAGAARLAGMRLTGPSTRVDCRYPEPASGIAIRRRDFDLWLLESAVRAGARFEPGAVVRRLLTDDTTHVRGVALGRSGTTAEVRTPALIVIGADGRRSTVARHADLHVPARVRRWAFGAYATGVAGMSDLGEMHVRPGAYCGLAPLGDGVVNVCVVTTPTPGTPTAVDVIRRVVARDPDLAARLASARFEGPGQMLGPLAADVRAVGVPGLLLAGDAAGFVDPMTGDGIHLAMQGARLAAIEALRAVEQGTFAEAVTRLARARRRQFGGKVRVNRLLRSLVDVPALVDAAAFGARVAPAVLRRVVTYAGDVR